MAENTSWKNTIGAFLTKKGMAIGSGLVLLGSALQGTTNWVDFVVNAIKGFFA